MHRHANISETYDQDVFQVYHSVRVGGEERSKISEEIYWPFRCCVVLAENSQCEIQVPREHRDAWSHRRNRDWCVYSNPLKESGTSKESAKDWVGGRIIP